MSSPRPESDWTYRETIDEELSAIRAHGRVGSLGVDLLRGTVEELSRRGHRHITVTMDHPDDVDACARAVLAEVAAQLARCNCLLTIRWSDPGVTGPAPHAIPPTRDPDVRKAEPAS